MVQYQRIFIMIGEKMMFVNQNADAYDRETEEYIVAYLDLLGVTNRIKDYSQDELSMNKLHNLYTFSMSIMKDLEQRKKDIKSLLRCTGHFQELAASDSVGWMLRGGVAIGQLYIDEVMVWGKALLTAYELEDKVANYPRVIIDEDVVNEISSVQDLQEYLRLDFDGLYYLNYLADCHFCGRMLMQGFEIMKKEVGYTYNERLKQKFLWHMKFVNDELDRKNEKKDIKYRLSM